MPPQHHLSRGVVQHVAGVYLTAQDGGDGPLGAEQEFTARIIQIGRVYDPVAVTVTGAPEDTSMTRVAIKTAYTARTPLPTHHRLSPATK